jgi:hypothetical protein
MITHYTRARRPRTQAVRTHAPFHRTRNIPGRSVDCPGRNVSFESAANYSSSHMRLNLLGRPQRVRAKALPECMEAPAGLACRLSLPYAEGTWVDPAHRACPTSARASARCGRPAMDAPEIQTKVNVSENCYKAISLRSTAFAAEDAVSRYPNASSAVHTCFVFEFSVRSASRRCVCAAMSSQED